MARHRSMSSICSGSGARAGAAGASYRLPISGQVGQNRTAAADAASASSDATRATHHHPVTCTPEGVRPRSRVAWRAESRACARPTTTVTTSVAATSAPRTATLRRTRPRVTRTTPQAASATRPSAPARGTCPPVSSTRAEPGRPSGTAHGLAPARAQSPAPTIPPTTAGANHLRSAIRVPGLPDHPAVEARAGAGVAGRALLVDLEQERVAVAVHADPAYPLAVTRGVALGPVLRATAAPVRRAPGLERAGEGLVVHPSQHQHLAGVVLLGHRRDQSGVVPLQQCCHGRVEVHVAIVPSAL